MPQFKPFFAKSLVITRTGIFPALILSTRPLVFVSRVSEMAKERKKLPSLDTIDIAKKPLKHKSYRVVQKSWDSVFS